MVKCPGVIGWKANAPLPGWKVWESAPLLPGGMGTGGIDRYIMGKLEIADFCPEFIIYLMQTEVGSLKFLKATKWFAKINIIKNGEATISEHVL